MRAVDLSNYDYDPSEGYPGDAARAGQWVPELIAAGVQGAIIGSQRMGMARWQLRECQAGGLPVIASYAEPDVPDAIALANEAGAEWVAIAVEPGSVQSLAVLMIGIQAIRGAGMKPVIYGNKGDVLSVVGASNPITRDVPLWLASYFDDQRIITSVSWWGKLWGHQFTSSASIGRPTRDLSEIFMVEVPDMASLEERVKRLEDLVAGNGFQIVGEVITGETALEAAEDDGGSLFLGLGQTQKQLADHIANHAAGISGPVADHSHEGKIGKVIR